MKLFLFTFLALYGSMHLYAFVRLRFAFRLGSRLSWVLFFWMGAMTVAPLLVRGAETSGMTKAAQFMAWPAYLWMGFVFILTVTLLFFEMIFLLYRLFIRLSSKQTREPALSFRSACGWAVLLTAIASVYAVFEADRIRSEHIVIPSSKLPAGTSKIRIVQISDMHIGLLLQEHRFEQMLEKVRAAGPDIFISTGDLVDGKLNARDSTCAENNLLAQKLAAIPAPSGRFAVIGNHEVYAGLPPALAFSGAAGFTILRNQSVTLKNGITITGVDDRAINPKSGADPGSETALLTPVSRDSFRLLLKHRPDILPENDGRFDLQLSGHVHGGQIFPFNFLVRLKHPIPCGITVTTAGSRIYVSRGTGTWGPPMRLFAPPEITIIDIVRQQAS